VGEVKVPVEKPPLGIAIVLAFKQSSFTGWPMAIFKEIKKTARHITYLWILQIRSVEP
jgi:hypothetical protein